MTCWSIHARIAGTGAVVHRASVANTPARRVAALRVHAASVATVATLAGPTTDPQTSVAALEPQHPADPALAQQPTPRRKGRRPGSGKVQHISTLLGIPLGSAKRLHPRIPNIRSLTNDEFTQRIEELEDTLQLPRRKLAALISKDPDVVWTPADQLATNLACIREELQVDHAALQNAICAHPDLLTAPTPAVRAQLRAFLSKIAPDVAPQVVLDNYFTLVDRHPFLTNRRPDSAWLQQFVSVFGVSNDAALEVLSKAPHLVSLSPVKLKPKLTFFATLLSLSPSATLDLVTRRPALLRVPHQRAAATLAALQSTLALTPRAAARIATRHPRLLILSAPTLAAKYANLLALLALPPAPTRALLARVPLLLLYSIPNLARKTAALSALLHLAPPRLGHLITRDPSLLTITPTRLGTRLAALQSTLRLPADAARALIIRQPIVLTRIPSSAALLSRLTAVSHALSLPLDATRTLVLRNCTLLLNNPATLSTKLAALQSALAPLALESVAALISASPSILNYKTPVLAARWQALRHAAQQHPGWAHKLGGYKPSTLALMLTKRDAVYRRLQYVALAGLQEHIALSSVLIFPYAKFVAACPGYSKWDENIEGHA